MSEEEKSCALSREVKSIELPDMCNAQKYYNVSRSDGSSIVISSCTSSNTSIINESNYELEKYPLPESPVVYTYIGDNQLQSPSNPNSTWIPPEHRCSSMTGICVDYVNTLGCPYDDVKSYIHYSQQMSSQITKLHSGSHQGIESPSAGCPTVSLDTKTSCTDSASAVVTICRICHMPGDDSEILISPCRCAGTMEFIHNTCLMKWLDITSKHSRKPPRCELCHFQYLRHKKFKFNQFRCPKISRQDQVLHAIFLTMMVVMVGCAVATVMCFLSDKGQISKFPRNKVDLTTEEIITLSCGVLFFVSFFVAMSVQIKAKHTVYQLFLKFIMQNMEWEIDEYDKHKDSLFLEKMHKNSYRSPPAYV